MISRAKICAATLVAGLTFGVGCPHDLTPEERQQVTALKQEHDHVLGEIEAAKLEDAAYSGGLIKALVAARLEILKTNEALIDQRIHAIESGTPVTLATAVTEPAPNRAADLSREIEAQRRKVDDARAQAARYSGGLVQALTLSTIAIGEQTIAMLDQQRVIAQYGLAPASVARAAEALATPTQETTKPTAGATSDASATPIPTVKDCLRIENMDSAVQSINSVYAEVAWKADIVNDCDTAFFVTVTFKIYDAQELELDSDRADVSVPARGVGKARDKMLVSPPDKARRIARQGVDVSAN